jgi:hypothetical protein
MRKATAPRNCAYSKPFALCNHVHMALSGKRSYSYSDSAGTRSCVYGLPFVLRSFVYRRAHDLRAGAIRRCYNATVTLLSRGTYANTPLAGKSAWPVVCAVTLADVPR